MSECDGCNEKRGDVRNRKVVFHSGPPDVMKLCPGCARGKRQKSGIKKVFAGFGSRRVFEP